MIKVTTKKDKKELKSLAKIGKGTKRKKREVSLLEVSEEMKSLYNTHKSLEKVAKIVKLSPEMVREFLKITELEKEVKKLINNGKINSVDIGYRISKLNGSDQIILAKHVVDRNLSSNDVRAIVKYKIDNPEMSIKRVIDKIIKSKDKKIYVAYLGIKEEIFEQMLVKIKDKNVAKSFKYIFYSFIPRDQIVSFELNGRVVILKVTNEGLKETKKKAKEFSVPLSKLADALMEEYLKRQ